MADTKNSIHVAMFPWIAFGHFTPYLHLANKLAERGHRVSYLLPKGTIPKLTEQNQYPDLIKFFPLLVPHVDGLPSGAETCSDVPFPLHNHLATAFDQTKTQVKTILDTIKPNFVFYDLACWIPSLGKELGFKSIMYSVLGAAGHALRVVPAKKIIKGMTFEELMQTPPGYPSLTVVPRPDEVAQVRFLAEELGSGLPFYERLVTSKKESDAITIRTCYEIEAPFIDYLSKQYSKQVLLTGPVLPEEPISQLGEVWGNWLSKFEEGSVVYCAFGSQIVLEKKQFQELVLGFELSGLPFLVALKPPNGCSTIEEALPEGFEERVKERGCVYGGWVPQPQILEHPSVGCFISHCGFGSMWESLLSDCQIVLVPHLGDQIVNTMLMVEDLKVAVEVKRGENGWISKENLSKAIKSVMDKDSEVAMEVKSNHVTLKKVLAGKKMQETYVDSFIKNLLDLMK